MTAVQPSRTHEEALRDLEPASWTRISRPSTPPITKNASAVQTNRRPICL